MTAELLTITEAADRLQWSPQQTEEMAIGAQALRGVVTGPLGAELLVGERFVELVIENLTRPQAASDSGSIPAGRVL